MSDQWTDGDVTVWTVSTDGDTLPPVPTFVAQPSYPPQDDPTP